MRYLSRFPISRSLAIILVCQVLFIQCDESQIDPNSANGIIESTIVERITPIGSEQYLNTNSDYIFDQSSLHTFEITIPEANLRKIDKDPAAEQYVEASLTFQGEKISPVAIRYKGSIGAFVNCLSGGDWSEPSGYKTCTKLSMKVKANWDDSDAKFYGLKKLQFHSQNLDDSQLHERLGYWLFREMGVPAPRSVHARLVINGEYIGLFALTEQIDGRFARHNFDDGTGNVYKEIWPVDMNGRPYPDRVYLNHLKTNEEDNPSAQMIRSFGQEISDASDAKLKDVISKWMNVSEIMALVAVDRTIRADDGPFHWYCGGGGNCSNHNYYWYEDPSLERMHLIPWDLDNAFENIIRNVNPVTPIADEWGEISSDCKPFRYGLFQGYQRSAACDRLTFGWTLFQEEYQLALSKLLEGPFSKASVDRLLNEWQAQIEASTIEASQKHSDAISDVQWKNAVDELRLRIEAARQKAGSD